MARDWLADRTQDLASPFLLRRDALQPIEDDIEGGGGGPGGTAPQRYSFSQAGGAPATATASPPNPVVSAGTVTKVMLLTSAAPEGSALTVVYRKNGVVFATLQIPDGSTTPVSLTEGLPTVIVDDILTVAATDVGSGVPAQGLTALVVVQ